MLFYPRNEVRIIFFSIQGIFPKRQRIIAERIGRMVADELLSAEEIKVRITSPEQIGSIKSIMEEKIEDYLWNIFPRKYPVTSVFFSNSRKQKFKEDLVGEVERMAPDVVTRYFSNLDEELDIEKIIQEKVSQLPPNKLENLINSILKKEFRFLEIVGAIIGFFIGLVQVLLALI